MNYKRIKKIKRTKPKRRPSLGAAKMLWRNKALWAVLFSIIISGTLAYNILFSPFFEVGDIAVSGNTAMSDGEFFNYIFPRLFKDVLFFSTRSIFLTDTAEIEKYILEIPYISQARVNKKWPDGLNVAIKEREGQALWCQTDKCFTIDREGVIFGEFSESYGEEFIIRGPAENGELKLGDSAVPGDKMKDIIFVREFFEKDLGVGILEAAIVPGNRLNVTAKEGWRAYFEFPIELAKNGKREKGGVDSGKLAQTAVLKLILEEKIPAERRPELEYIDLRFSKVYYKYRD